MKYLVMCEGTNEETIINILLKNGCLKFTSDDLIGLRIYHIRNLDNPQIQDLLRTYNNPVGILRIGDTLTDKLKIPKDLKDIVSDENTKKYCTKPELEILLIINEGIYNKFNKNCKDKSQTKEFAKCNITYNGVRYDQTNDFLVGYYGGERAELLVANIKEYKRLKKKSHAKDENFLADLLK